MESKFFLKLVKRIVFVIYLFLIGMCIYTFTTKDKIMKNSKKVTVDIDFRDRIEKFR
ncbi:MAG: hypothetical protein LBB13_02235 [Rickettsiales bacterium]|nr:hypothetical protein [Rickettsiales bacterium]